MWLSTLFLVVVFGILGPATAQVSCHKKTKNSIFSDLGESIDCPGPFDPPDHIFCCDNFTSFAHCCDGSVILQTTTAKPKASSINEDEIGDENDIPLLSDSMAEKRSIAQGLAKLVGIILGVAAFVVILCVVCCCCCPFCLFYKRKHRGEVITNARAGEMQPQSQQHYPSNQGGGYSQIPRGGQPPPPGGMPYPPQGGMPYPPQGGVPYPPQQPGYTVQQPSYPPQSGYPEAAPPPYPGPPTDAVVQQGPGPQPQKLAAEYQTQPAYNPGAP